MYEAHFGLTSRPFGSKAEGTAVFSGPRQVETMTAIKKGLTALDAVVTVTGPAGVGKTSIVSRALDTISPNRMAAWLGRMPLGPDEVLHLLLAGFGVKTKAKGTIQRFAIFRRTLAERAAAGAPVAIVVEDAARIGADVLMELEALTAADTGDATSANIILMGQPGLKKMLAAPELARLNQRTRLRQSIEPLSQAEVNGYLKHCIRVAGGDYDTIFETGVAEIAFACSEGIPRVINTLCESAMAAAMEGGIKAVSAALMYKVAVDAFGYEGPMPDAAEDLPSEDSMDVPIIEVQADQTAERMSADPDADIDWEGPPGASARGDAESSATENAAKDEPVAVKAPLPAAAREIIVESGRYPELPEIPEDSPLANADDETTADEESANDVEPKEPEDSAEDAPAIPELIDDTQPELSILRSQPDDAPTAEAPGTDVESTAIQAQLSEDVLKEALASSEANAPAATDPCDAEEEDPAADQADAVTEAMVESDVNAPETEDLDAALTFETESTNIMEGITTNIDEAAGVTNDGQTEPSANDASKPPSPEDIPTLTDSMQVDTEKAARKATPADTGLPTKEPKTEPPTAAAPLAAVEAVDQKDEMAKSTPEPVAAAPEPSTVRTESVPDTAAEQAALQAALTPDLDSVTGKSPSKPIAQVSEMTARIAALDPEKRKDDVETLEAALDAAKRSKLDDMMAPPPAPPVNGTREAETAPAAPIPEITLDDQIAEKQAEIDARRKEFAAEIGKANSLEEFSDAMAETLFGDEDFDAIAAEVTANPPTEVAAGTPAGEEAEEPSPVSPSLEETDEPSPVSLSLEAADEPSPVTLSLEEEPVHDDPPPEPKVAAEPPPVSGDGELRQSQLMRADMLQSLSASSTPDAAPEAPKPKPPPTVTKKPAAPAPEPQVAAGEPKEAQPESIEDQINTSMTQTLEALNVAKAAEAAADAEEDEAPRKKGGLFSRFRKSS